MSNEHNTKGGLNGRFNNVDPTKVNVFSLLLSEVVQYTSPLGGYTTVGQDFLRHFFIVFSSSPAYHPLPQITMSWVEILDQLVHFSTVV